MLSVAIFVSIGWIISVCLHEFGHAIAAYWGGDTSVKDKGYLTLNPLKYTDINLSLTLPLIFVLMGGIPLPGAAVYINHNRLRNRWWQSAVSAAGPVTSAIVALLLALPFKLGLALPNSDSLWIWSALAFLVYLQIYVTIINSLPIPSLDGYGIIEPWLPQQVQAQLGKFSKYGILFLFGMLWFVQPVSGFLGDLSASIASFLGVPLEMIGAGSSLFHRAAGILLLAAIGIIFIIRRLTRKTHEVRFEKGQTFSKSGQYEKAIAAYDQAIKHKPDYYEAWYNRGLALFNLERFDEAIASYDRTIQIKSSDEVWYERGLALHYSKRYEEAIASYDQAIQIKSDNVLAWFFRSLTLSVLQRYEDAIAGYDKAIQIKPDFASAWDHRGCILSELERYEDAIASHDKAIQIKPNDPGFWTDKGKALSESGRYEEAIYNYEQALKIEANYYLAWLNKGRAQEQLQRPKEANESYNEVIKIKPTNSFDWFMQAYALCKLQRYELALIACNKAMKSDPKYHFTWYCQACCYAEQNQVDLAIESLQQAINIDSRKIKKMAKTDPSFDSIRAHPLFKQLIDE